MEPIDGSDHLCLFCAYLCFVNGGWIYIYSFLAALVLYICMVLLSMGEVMFLEECVSLCICV